MNEHLWKKLGEVKAFALAGINFLERGKSGFASAEVFAEEETEKLIEANEKHLQAINKIAEAADATETVDAKAQATQEKIETLQDSYLTDADDWGDGMELLEWSGFFFGGAIVHWGVIDGAAKAISETELSALAEVGSEFHHQMLHACKESIKELAATEARE